MSRTVECRYNECGKRFSSKPRMKEHVLWHLETSPPVKVYQQAIVRYREDEGWTVLEDLSERSGEREEEPSQAGSSGDIEKFRISDIVPTGSQVGNVTTTTTTSGTTSQPYPFSPALPSLPSQLSLPGPSQTPLRPFNSLPTRSTGQSRESPFVHSAPRPSASPSPSVSNRNRLPTTSPVNKKTRLSASPFVPNPDEVRSSTPIIDRAGGTQVSTQSDSSQFPPPSGKVLKETPKDVQRTFGFGDALGLSGKKATPDVKSGVTFGFGTR